MSMFKTVLNAVLRQPKMVAHVEIGRFRCQSSSFLIRYAFRFQRPSRLRVLSIHLKRWCNKNNLTDTVLCIKGQYSLNICKFKRQTTTVRYSVAIIMFWWQFFGYWDPSFTAWRHMPHGHSRATFPQNCGIVGRVMKYNRGHLPYRWDICRC